MVSKLFKDRKGASAIEYSLIASLIALAAITSFANLGGKVQSHYNDVDSNLQGNL